MGKYNNLLNLESNLPEIPQTVTHTRGKTIFRPEWCKNKEIATERGSSIKINKLVQHLEKGSKLGERLFKEASNYSNSYLLSDDPKRENMPLPLFGTQDDDESSGSEDEDDLENILEDSDDDYSSNIITVKGKKMDVRSAISKFCNGGRITFGNKSRKSRFYGNCLENEKNLTI